MLLGTSFIIVCKGQGRVKEEIAFSMKAVIGKKYEIQI